MNDTTKQSRVDQTYVLIHLHPHKHELLQLIEEQMLDDLCNCAIQQKQP